MKTEAFRLALAVALFSVATHAFSQDGGLYLSAGTMATFAGPQDFEVGAKPAEDADFTANRKGTGTFDVGILGFRASVGYRIFGFRPEAEVSYRQLKLSGFEYTSHDRIPEDLLDALNESIKVEAGDLKLLGVMAYDIDTGSGFMPYLGGGVGLGHITPNNRSRLGSLLQEFPESSASFAFQAGAGVGFDIGAGVTVTISLGYRLYGTTEAELPWNALECRGH